MTLVSHGESSPDSRPALSRKESVQRNPLVTDELQQIFRDDLVMQCERLKEGLLSNDWHIIADVAHQLAGTLGFFGHPHLAALCQRLDASARAAPANERLTCDVSTLLASLENLISVA